MTTMMAPADALQGRRWDGPPSPTFVAIHGLGIGGRLVAPLATRLSAHGTVIAPDLPGVGASVHLGDDEERVSIAGHAATLSGWLRERDLRDVVLVGVSVGTQVAIRVAADDRESRIARLVLLSPTIEPTRRRVLDQLWRMPVEQSVNSWRFHALALEDQSTTGARRLWWLLRSALADRPEDLLGRIEIPALVLRGTLDPMVSHSWARRVADLLPHGSFQELTGVRHAMSFEDARHVAPAIVAFLSATAQEEQR